jgi:hypothetical protein
MSSTAAFTALVGSLCVSRVMSSICRPLTPPAALISLTARMVPRLVAIPLDELGPVSAGRADADRLGCSYRRAGKPGAKRGGAGGRPGYQTTAGDWHAPWWLGFNRQ